MSKLAIARVKYQNQGVQDAVQRVLRLIDYKSLLRGKSLFIKTNLISGELMPGTCVSPWFHDAILQEITKNFHGDIYLGDADLAADKQCRKAAKIWGVFDLCKKYKVKFINLSEDEQITVNLKGEVLQNVSFSKTILKVDSIIQLAPMKTHCLASLTCSLKGHWGLISRSRHNWHLVFDKAICDIASYFRSKVLFSCIDGTIAMQENGPRTGKPKIADLVIAGQDPVAIDSLAAKIMGFDPYKITHIVRAKERGIGKMNYKLDGDACPVFKFEPPHPEKQPIFKYEFLFRHIPFLKWFLFKTPVFAIPAKIATWYNIYIYFWGIFNIGGKGKKYLKEILKHPFYRKEFEPLAKKNRIIK